MQLLKEYPMPEHLKEIKEVEASFIVARYIAELFFNKLLDLEKERNIDTATIIGIERKEECYKIKPFETDTLEERRFRIQILEKEINIYNFQKIEGFIQDMSSDVAVVKRDFTDYKNPKLYVGVALASAKSFKEMVTRLKKMLPMDMQLLAEIIYTKFSYYENSTFGSLKAKTFNDLRERK